MICPRCSVAEISAESGECVLCGFSPSANVAVAHIVADEVQETIQRELAGKFELQLLVRAGVRSLVYLARDLKDDRLVALKLLPFQGPMSAELATRFQQEATLAVSLNHPHLVPVLDYGLSRTLLWYTMEAVKGRSLDQVLGESAPLAVRDGLRIIEQVGSALDYLHRRGIIHGDLKPANILIDMDGWVRVADAAIMHGIGRAADGQSGWNLTLAPEYVAPEQRRTRSVGASADQYALAVVAFEALAGALPFEPEHPETPRLLADIRPETPGHVSDAVRRAMARTPAQRFPSVLDFVAVLSGAWAPAARRAPAPPSRPSGMQHGVLLPEGRGRRLPLWVWLGAGVVIAGGAAFAVLSRDDAPPPRWSTVETLAPPAAPASEPVARAADSAAGLPAGTTVVATPPAEAGPDPTSRPVTERAAPPVTPRVTTPPVTESAALEPARLFINATPWGLLYIDDELVGNTPKANLELAPGTYRIRVVRDGFLPFERQIQVAPGQEVRITDIVLTPRQR